MLPNKPNRYNDYKKTVQTSYFKITYNHIN